MKANDQKLIDYQKIEEAAKKKFPTYEWEDIAMWMQMPLKELDNKSPAHVAAEGDIEKVLELLK